MSSLLKTNHSPMMKQWQNCKDEAKDALLFFRLGDFYEAFYEDAYIISKELNLTLTQRQKIPMCGVPYHASENYIDKLIAKGFKVGVAEQVEDPKKATGLVKRELVRIISPATVVNSSLLSEKKNNYFVSICQLGKIFGLSTIDLTTAEFRVSELNNKQDLKDELFRQKPKELLVSQKFAKDQKLFLDELSQSFSFVLNKKDDWYFDHRLATDTLLKHFKIYSLDSFGLKGMVAAVNASGALLSYLDEELKTPIDHIRNIKADNISSYMSLDSSCLKNLELLEPINQSNKECCLLNLIDRTRTAMGGRLIANWIKQPLLSCKEIYLRQNSIEKLLSKEDIKDDLISLLSSIQDLERLIMKISIGYAGPKDLVSLKLSIKNLPEIKELLSKSEDKLLIEAKEKIANIDGLYNLIDKALNDNPPLRISDAGAFKDGYNSDLDELRSISHNSKVWIANYQNKLRKKTNIKNLKVGFTRVFGYYIEVSKGQSEKAPDNFQRRQTLVNAERFITDELKEFEHKVLTSEDRIKALETNLYNKLRENVSKYSEKIFLIAKSIAVIDSLISLSVCAKEYNYIKPLVDTSNILYIEDGRHPIIEKSMQLSKFIPNDTKLDDDNRLFLITGPNMSGKSTYMRQVAMIVIMAQIGSYVPASSAHIGIVDKVFTRIGANDDISRGQSTFMVEMNETANILNNATSRSLVILDEIGRGTSTYDGISIAWAVAEFLLTTEGKKTKTLFATHYWELTEMEEKIPGAINYNVSVEETDTTIAFLHKIIKGGTDKSYGIHVARLAGLPYKVLKKAEKMLTQLEKNTNNTNKTRKKSISEQFCLFDMKQKKEETHPVINQIKNLDLDSLSPKEAQQKLYDLKNQIK
jgi:DNA mismatch repair protein MutS